MTAFGRLILFIYNLVILGLAGLTVAATLGWLDPQVYLSSVLDSTQNRMIAGVLGILVGFLALLMLMWSLRPSPRTDTVMVDKGIEGDVTMSIAAVKAIIMKAIRQVDGVKEMRPEVVSSPNGVKVKLHTMINPEHNVPEISHTLQTTVRESLEKVGGLQVAEIKILIDDFVAAGK
ncbi:MAG: alkaline shock response membrane anchor protein AmaP [Syntrophomonadaceae bacterium]